MEIKQLRPARKDSYEAFCSETGLPRFVLDVGPGAKPELVAALARGRLERFIGVIYRPQTERAAHYVEAELPAQFDAWVWFAETRAVTAPADAGLPLEPETYPTGL